MRAPFRSRLLFAGLVVATLAVALALSGCSDHARGADPETDKWLGQWNGPEGTFLRLAGGAGSYEITIQNLDGPRTFKGSASNSVIRFERDGVAESIHATNGVDTGMKWLRDKTNCLTVRSGEGYCRD